jgi:hypothetical protein
MIELGKMQKNSLRKACARQVEGAFQDVGACFVRARWLDTNNPYADDCIQALVDHTKPGQSIQDVELSEYIAASAPLHCTDGWALLGRALDAHARRDTSTATHLAYYAELRAAMSLLATEGIGIFNDRHFVVTSTRKCEPVGKLNRSLKTHTIAWLALEYWAGLPRAADLFRCIIQPGGIPLGEWLDAFGARTMSRSIAKKWLKTWGLDLRRLSAGEDREARNQASYRPTRLNYSGSLGVSDCSSFVCNLWQSYEPSTSSRFDILDRHLLRLILERSYAALPKSVTREFADQISAMLNIVLPGISLTEQWKSFLMRIVQPDDPVLITEASGTADVGHPRHHLQVLSRAALLLRVATGACAQLLQSGSVGRTELEFWWKPLGEERGFLEPGDELVDLTELWGDIQASVEDLFDWEVRNGKAMASYSKWRQDLPRQISIIGECERIALWGLGL